MAIKFNLPGQKIDLLDGFLGIENANVNPSIVVLGTGLKGTRGLVALRDTQTASNTFGAGSELARKISQVFAGFGPSANVSAYRIGGSPLVLDYADEYLGTGALYGWTNITNAKIATTDRHFMGGFKTGTKPRVLKEYQSAAVSDEPYTATHTAPASGILLNGTITFEAPYLDTFDANADYKLFIVPTADAYQVASSFITSDAADSATNSNILEASIITDIFAGTVVSTYWSDWTALPAPVVAGGGGPTDTIQFNIASLVGSLVEDEVYTFILAYWDTTATAILDPVTIRWTDNASHTYEDPVTNDVITAWEYTSSGASFYNLFKTTFAQEHTGIKITSASAEDDLADTYGVLLTTATELFEIYNLDTNTLVYSNDDTNPIDLGIFDVEITGDLASANFIDLNDDEVDQRIANFDDPLFVPVPDATPSPVSVTKLLQLPNTLHNMYISVSDAGASITKRERYTLLEDAYSALLYGASKFVIPAEAYIDDPNVAYYYDATKYKHDPTGNDEVLGWLRTVELSPGVRYYFWDEETTNGGDWADASARLADSYHEVNFGYQLARFCHTSTANGNICRGMIGVNAPRTGRLEDYRIWIGAEPTFDETTGAMLTPGSGLLGTPYSQGTTATNMNILVRERDVAIGSTNGERAPGLFDTDSNEYDGTVLIDENGHVVDIGKYICMVAEWPIFITSDRSIGFTDSMDCYFAGFVAARDPKSSPTSKQVKNLRSRFQIGLSTEEKLVAAKFIFLSDRGSRGTIVVDGMVLSTDASDWTRISTLGIVDAIMSSLTQAGQSVEGVALTDAERIAFGVRIDETLAKFAKGGYLNGYDYQVTQTRIGSKLGNLRVKLALNIPEEIRIVTWVVDLA